AQVQAGELGRVQVDAEAAGGEVADQSHPWAAAQLPQGAQFRRGVGYQMEVVVREAGDDLSAVDLDGEPVPEQGELAAHLRGRVAGEAGQVGDRLVGSDQGGGSDAQLGVV